MCCKGYVHIKTDKWTNIIGQLCLLSYTLCILMPSNDLLKTQFTKPYERRHYQEGNHMSSEPVWIWKGRLYMFHAKIY